MKMACSETLATYLVLNVIKLLLMKLVSQTTLDLVF